MPNCHRPTSPNSRRTPSAPQWPEGWQGEAKVIEGLYNYWIIATRNIVDHNRTVWAMRAPLLALLLG